MNEEPETSTVVGKEPCPKCGSRDTLARSTDGHAHCFGATCDYWEPGDGATSSAPRPRAEFSPLDYQISPLAKRGLSQETCAKFSYGVNLDDGVHVANYYDPDTRRLIAQKVRRPDKSFSIIGQGANLPLYGQWLWRGDRRSLIITEG